MSHAVTSYRAEEELIGEKWFSLAGTEYVRRTKKKARVSAAELYAAEEGGHMLNVRTSVHVLITTRKHRRVVACAHRAAVRSAELPPRRDGRVSHTSLHRFATNGKLNIASGTRGNNMRVASAAKRIRAFAPEARGRIDVARRKR